MDRPSRFWRPARESTYRWSHLFYKPKLRAATLASISDLHWLQSHRILAQRLRQLAASIRYERRICLVHYWVRYNLDHGLGMLVSKLRQWQVCFYYLYKWYAILK